MSLASRHLQACSQDASGGALQLHVTATSLPVGALNQQRFAIARKTVRRKYRVVILCSLSDLRVFEFVPRFSVLPPLASVSRTSRVPFESENVPRVRRSYVPPDPRTTSLFHRCLCETVQQTPNVATRARLKAAPVFVSVCSWFTLSCLCQGSRQAA